MKISCLQDNLAKGLSIVSRAVSPRSTLPVLGNVLLAVDNGRLKLSATNLEIVITCWLGATVQEAGATTVPARTFSELINTFPQERVDLTLNKTTETLHVACGKIQANVKGINANEFPVIPDPDQENRIRMEPGVLKRVISQVAFAAATDDSRPSLTGVSTTFEGSRVVMAATDGFRLSVRSAHIAGYVEKPFNVIIPARALHEVARIISDDLEAVYISMPAGRNQIIFDLDNALLVSQLIDGKFPDYQPIIPQRHTTRTVLNTAEFTKACRTADIFARESSNTARVSVEPGDGLSPAVATVAANSKETGDNVAQVDANVDGMPIEIAFNVKFMADALSVIETPQVALETTGPNEPGVLKPVGDNDFVHIIMPMNFNR
jgi:DNA polymerase-3 subunit beta